MWVGIIQIVRLGVCRVGTGCDLGDSGFPGLVMGMVVGFCCLKIGGGLLV